ncbi:MAG: hypothetical protein NTY83_01795 [Candidatus Micrarchaeota archaeon]|nr:hypothetical protein [Candidatus Micrarchaeota archaeon]
MKSMKAFIFSLDSFVAFTLTVAALYTLVFFSTVPSAYYAGLMQANYLAKDTLLSLATTSYSSDQTYLDKIIGDLNDGQAQSARGYIGALVPPQFGYRLESYDEDAVNWITIYDTASDPDPPPNRNTHYYKLKATAKSVYLIVHPARSPGGSPYWYMSCGGNYTVCGEPPYDEGMIGNASLQLIRFTVYT